MDEILEGKVFVDSDFNDRPNIYVVIDGVPFIIKKEDIDPFILDNRRIENV